jgi:hypothetical protein
MTEGRVAAVHQLSPDVQNGPLPNSLACPTGLASGVEFKFVETIWEKVGEEAVVP